jgi:hypothetical protein
MSRLPIYGVTGYTGRMVVEQARASGFADVVDGQVIIGRVYADIQPQLKCLVKCFIRASLACFHSQSVFGFDCGTYDAGKLQPDTFAQQPIVRSLQQPFRFTIEIGKTPLEV